ncbi:amino acid ABC transporter permease [Hydrogenoanaerobacterium saccharovorans]|uniref:Amino acid ABC transporter permease n=1 Tax=Hydrogenoanaerobacterium saccharovorans TaxID=474960 RepID=A0ABS2GLN1_9FIRM|nr:amino acid ABC transporter permease [Hydrogenoanaerobacterium saccharovorans]MBM6923016.1 amino acid ABC transporter permease [Hydrogenoanaerobacterium saccharovorans]
MALPEANDFFGWVAYILNEYGSMLLSGAWKTMVIAVISTAIGCVIGFAVGIVQTIPTNRQENPVHWAVVGFFKALLNAYVEIFRGTPMMVQAAFIYYGAAMLFDIHMGTWTAALFIVSINTGAYMAETVRGGILSIDPGQTEGAMAIGMNHMQIMTNVILPQALRNIMPQIGNNLIINIKDTCVLSIISVVELFYNVKSIVGATYAFFPAYSIAMVIYFILTFTCSRILRVIEDRMAGPDSYDLAMNDTLMGEGMTKYRPRPVETNADYRARQEQPETSEGGM